MRFRFAITLPLMLLACAEGSADTQQFGQPAQPAAGSCLDHCGDSDPVASCYCDDECNTAGDCCSDYEDVCASTTSNEGGGGGASGAGGGASTSPSGGGSGGSGGGPSTGVGGGCSVQLCQNTDQPAYEGGKLCFCDSTCAGTGDCCSNKVAVCG